MSNFPPNRGNGRGRGYSQGGPRGRGNGNHTGQGFLDNMSNQQANRGCGYSQGGPRGRGNENHAGQGLSRGGHGFRGGSEHHGGRGATSNRGSRTGHTSTALVAFKPVAQDQPLVGALPSAAVSNTSNPVSIVKSYAAKTKRQEVDPVAHYEKGLRIEYGTTGTKTNSFVTTNYVKILSRPKVIHVYRVEMQRERIKKDNSTKSQGNDPKPKENTDIKQRLERMSVFDHVAENPPFAQYGKLASQKCYATDYDLIWSVHPLFDDEDPTSAPPAIDQPFGVQHNRTRLNIPVGRFRIVYSDTLNLDDSVANLYSESTWVAQEKEISSVLTRGLNALLTEYAREKGSAMGYTNHGANKFFINKNHVALDVEGTKAVQGFFSSIRPGSESLLLNINVATSPFHQPVNVLAFINKCRTAGRSWQETIKCLKGKEVLVLGTDKVRIIQAVGDRDDQMKHKWQDIVLHRLVVNCGENPLVNKAAVDYHLAENLRLLDNQPFRGRLTADQISEMIKFACKPPLVNMDLIQERGLDLLGIIGDHNQTTLKRFGLEFSRELLQIPSRFLQAPDVLYKGGKASFTGPAEWNLIKKQLSKVVALHGLSVFDLHNLIRWTNHEPNLQRLSDAIRESLGNNGVLNRTTNINFVTPALNGQTPQLSVGELQQLIRDSKIDLRDPVLVIIPKHDQDLYATIKRLSDLVLGFNSVCAVSDKLGDFGFEDQRGNMKGLQHIANIGLKLNLKNHGVNHRVAKQHLSDILFKATNTMSAKARQFDCDTIVIGADVSHPTASAIPGCPSIAAVVGSVDDDYVQYPGSMRLQKSGMEYIEDLADMVKERLVDFAEQHDGRLPSSTLFYRDGVSESQFSHVRNFEMPQIQAAYNEAKKILDDRLEKKASDRGLYPRQRTNGDVPFKLTFIIVSKRNKTKFFAHNEQDGIYDKNGNPTGNVKPGFVIDHTITHPLCNDFYLQSHKPLQGTGSPTHYFVLKNQMRLSANDLQNVTHAFCYVYARTTKAVSYCAPAYYADRLCDRGQAYMRDLLLNRNVPGDYKRKKTESFDDFKKRIRDSIRTSQYWRPHGGLPQQYGGYRRNPWDPKLDGVMFYL